MTASLDPDIITAARSLAPRIIAARTEIEQARRIPDAIASALADAGLYRMYLPRVLGGLELSPLTAFAIIEELSKADGSVGWCLMNANGVALSMAWLAPEVGRHMVAAPSGFRAAGSLRPQGRAWPVEGGFRVTGQWNFASGLQNATWLYCPSVMMDGDTLRQTPGGAPAVRALWVPVDAVTVFDNWSVMGLRGTGSVDFRVKDLFVPESRAL